VVFTGPPLLINNQIEQTTGTIQLKATLIIDRDRAARLGIQPTLIDATIYDAIGQRDVAQYFMQLNNYHVVLEVDRSQ